MWRPAAPGDYQQSLGHAASISVGEATLTPSPTSTVFYSDGGPFIDYPLMCPENIPLESGLSWRGIIVGQSYLQDLEDLYGVVAAQVEPNLRGTFAPVYRISLTGKASLDRQLAIEVEACVVNWKIAALMISPVNDQQLSDAIETWVGQFGAPEIVSWSVGGSWRYRDLIWPKKGLALHVDLGDASLRMAYIATVVFFSPLRLNDDLSRWPYSQLRKLPPTMPNDEGYPEAVNPFDFAHMRVTATAQASFTPSGARMSTLIPSTSEAH